MKPAHKKVAAGSLAAGTIVLAAAMFNHWEGRNYTVVHLPFDPPGVYTVCGGITNADIPNLRLGQHFTEPECLALIQQVIPKYADPVRVCVDNFDAMPPHRQAALIDVSVNLGPGVACGQIARLLNAGDVKAACDYMTRYIYANGKRLQGLVNRRNDPVWGEKPWCLRED